MRFKTLSWRAFPHHVLTPFPFQSSLIPSLHFSWSVNLLLLRDFQTFMRARWMKAISPPICHHPNASTLLCLLLSMPLWVACTFSALFFFSCIALSPIPLSRAPRLNQIGRISVAAWLHRYHGHQREQKSITSPLPFHQLSFPSVFVALPPSIFPLFCFTASSSSLSSEYHSAFPSYFNMLPFPFSPSKKKK